MVLEIVTFATSFLVLILFLVQASCLNEKQLKKDEENNFILESRAEQDEGAVSQI